MSEKTVFISYRRDATGKAFARSIKTELTYRGYDVFLDVDSMDAGQWAAQILTQVPKRAHFLLLLTPGALDRCSDEDDWVRREFLAAVEHGRNIVPVREESVDLVAMRKASPAAVTTIFDFQSASILQASFEGDIETLANRYIPPHKAPGAAASAARPRASSFRADISRIIKYAPAELIGREDETRLLDDAWAEVQSGERSAPTSSPSSPSAARGRPRSSPSGRRTSRIRTGRGATPPSRGPSTARARASRRPLRPTCFSRKPSPSSATRRWPAAPQARSRKAGGSPSSSASGGPAHPRRPGAAAIRAHLAHAGRTQGPGHRRAAQGAGRHQPRPVRRHHPVSPSRTCGPSGDHRAGGEPDAPVHRGRRGAAPVARSERQSAGRSKRGRPEPLNEFEKLVEDVKGHALTLNLLGSYLRDAHAGDIRKRDRVKLDGSGQTRRPRLSRHGCLRPVTGATGLRAA